MESFRNIDDLIERIGEVGYLPEGVIAARGAQELIASRDLKLPITSAVYRILNREADPVGALAGILRSLTGASFHSVLASDISEEHDETD